MWIIVIIAPVFIIIIILFICLIRKLRCKKKKEVSHVSISFPLPPPTGESEEIMDETQYDVRVKALRESKSKEEGGGSVELEEEQVRAIGTLMRDEKREDTKRPGPFQNKKEPRFLFEAPPPYEENPADPPGQKRMVSIKLADLPIRKVGDMRVFETSSNPSSSTKAASDPTSALARTGSGENTARSISPMTSGTSKHHKKSLKIVQTQPTKTFKDPDTAKEADGGGGHKSGSKKVRSKEKGSKEPAGSKELPGSKEPAVSDFGSTETTATNGSRRRSRRSRKNQPDYVPDLSKTQKTDIEELKKS